MNSSLSIGNTANARSTAQVDHMKATVEQGKCPFCDDSGFDPTVNVVIKQGVFWRAWLNPFPYKGSKRHVILATIDHVVDVKDLSAGAWIELGEFIPQIIAEYKIEGGGIVMRFGDNKLNGGTLTHLHVHIQEPNQTSFSVAVFYKDAALTEFLAEAAERAKVS